MLRLAPVIGHRGAAAAAPENTLAGLAAAAALGARWVEFDVMLSADEVPVLHHDDNLKRTTGLDRLVVETPLAELRRLDAGGWFSPAFAGERIPTLEEAVACLLERGLIPNLEIKPPAGRDVVTAEVIVSQLGGLWPKDRPAPLISSFSRMALAAVRVLAPGWPRGLVADGLPEDWLATTAALGCASLHLGSRGLSRAQVAEVKKAGLKVAVFTVNRPARARELLSWGVDAVFTDRVAEVLQGLS